MNKNNRLIAVILVALTFNVCAMEQPDVKKIGWVAFAGSVLVGGALALNKFLSYIHAEPIKSFTFVALPNDVQHKIIGLLTINNSAKSLEEAAQAINSLAQINHYLNDKINDPQFCLEIIKHLAQQFNCTDEAAAKALQTQEARRRLRLQYQNHGNVQGYNEKGIVKGTGHAFFPTILGIHLDTLENMVKEGVDFSFTYEKRSKEEMY